MSEFQLYSNAYLTIEGTVLTQETEVSVEQKSGLIPQFTVPLGFAGMSQGAPYQEIKIENAVPSADFEVNPTRYMRTGQPVEVGVIMANRQMITKGFVTDATFQHGVNKASSLSMTLMCALKDFE